MNEDFWGFKDLIDESTNNIFLGILQQQKEVFIEKTKGILQIEILNKKIDIQRRDGFKLTTEFNIVAPYLDDYSYTLFTVYSKPEKNYPIAIDTQITLDKQVIENKSWYEDFAYECKDEEQFIMVLEKILSSTETTQIVQNLYTKSKIEWNDETE